MDTNIPDEGEKKKRKLVQEVARNNVLNRLGRGRGGGSVFMALRAELAHAAGRPVIIADGDRRNPTLASLYPPGSLNPAFQPTSDEPAVTKKWITGMLSLAIEQQSSLMLDMGGGDTSMQDLMEDVDLVRFMEKRGHHPVGLFFCGADMDDFDHILSIWRAGYFRPQRSILILNEFLTPHGYRADGAFKHIYARKEMHELLDGGIEIMTMPKLACMAEVRGKGLGFFDAVNGKDGVDNRPLDPVGQHMVEEWIEKVENNLAAIGALEWMP